MISGCPLPPARPVELGVLLPLPGCGNVEAGQASTMEAFIRSIPNARQKPTTGLLLRALWGRSTGPPGPPRLDFDLCRSPENKSPSFTPLRGQRDFGTPA